MAKEYVAPKTINRIMMWMAGRGIGGSVVLTTIGRLSGGRREVPVSPIEMDGIEYIVAPYGSVGWVSNVRARPDVTIRKGTDERRVRLAEVTDGRAQVVKAYYEREGYARKYMDLPESPELADFERAGASFPVFRVEG